MARGWRLLAGFSLLAVSATAASLTLTILEDHSGAAIPSAEVRISKPGVSALVADLESDGQGRMEARDLAEGEYHIDISKPNYLGATLTLHLSAAGSAASMRLIRYGAIAGEVVEPNGQPVRGAVVLAMRKSTDGGWLQPESGAGHRTTTDSQGRYRLYNLAPGQYAMAVSYGASTTAVNTVGSPATPPNLGSGVRLYPDNARPRLFDISGGEDIHAGNFIIVTGVLSSVSGKVDFSDPQASFWLALTPVDQPALAAAVTLTDPDGSFHFKGVPDGSYYLFASGPARARNQGGALDAQPSFWRSRADVAGHDVTDVRVTPEKGRSVTIALRIPDQRMSGTTPPCPATAQVRFDSVEDWAAALQRQLSASTANEETVSYLAPARYRVSVSGLKEGCYLTENPVVDLSGGDAPGKIELTLAAAGSIRGRVHGASSDSVVVLLSETLPSLRAASPDAESQFSFTGIRPGKYRIAVQSAREGSPSHWISDPARMLELEVPGGRTIEIDLAAPAPPNK